MAGEYGERAWIYCHEMACLFFGLESDRDDLRQGQAAAAIAGLPHARAAMGKHAVGAGPDHRLRRRQLLSALRLYATNELGML